MVQNQIKQFRSGFTSCSFDFFSLRMFVPNQGCIFCKLHSDWNRVSGKQQCCCQTVTMILINHKIEEISHATEVSVTFDEHYSKYLNIVYCTQTICLVKSYHPQQQWPRVDSETNGIVLSTFWLTPIKIMAKAVL